MRAYVDQEECSGCGSCIDLCPEVFQWDEDYAAASPNPVPEQFQAACREAEDSCPTEAITIEE